MAAHLLSSPAQGSCLSETQAHVHAVDLSRLPAQTFSEENLKVGPEGGLSVLVTFLYLW